MNQETGVRIIGGTDERGPKEFPYPNEIELHPWSLKGIGERPDFLISKKAEEKMRNHCFLDPTVEAMGFLVGDIYADENGPFMLARDAVTSPTISSEYHVAFNKDEMNVLAEKLDFLGFDYLIVGWYHSHPGLHSFLSSTDITTQKNLFKNALTTALVLDPLNKELAAFRLDDDQEEEFPVVIYLEEHQDPFALPEAFC